METSYDVRIYKILTYRGSRKTSYTVRWMVAGKPFREPFGTSALADSFRSELVSAARRGEAFSLTTGRPISHQSGAGAVSWYDFAIQFTDAQWRRTSGNNRKNVAKALMTTTIALLRAPLPSRFAAIDVRTALREFAFNTRRRKEAPQEVTAILRWVERNTLTMAATPSSPPSTTPAPGPKKSSPCGSWTRSCQESTTTTSGASCSSIRLGRRSASSGPTPGRSTKSAD